MTANCRPANQNQAVRENNRTMEFWQIQWAAIQGEITVSNAEYATSDPAPDVTTERTLAMIGQRIRDLRKARNMTLQVLADATGLSSSMLSLVERGLASPSIASLIVIGEALGRSFSALVSEVSATGDELVTRSRDARITSTGGVIRRVMREDLSAGVTVTVIEHLPQAGTGTEQPTQDGFDYGLLIEGTLIVEIDDTSHLLYAGDLIAYPARRPHRIWNPGAPIARSVWFNLVRK